MAERINFTVIIPTRNRPQLLKKAINSVLDQDYSSYEILVINDGSSSEFAEGYGLLAKEFKDEITFFELEATKNGHGQSYAMNRGADRARGTYLCFLDDDDFWIDSDHLKRAELILFANDEETDLYYTNQIAFRGDTQIPAPLWLQDLEQKLSSVCQPDHNGVFNPPIKELMACSGFQHLNTSIIRRSFYLGIGGMDENIRYECDLDLYLRSVDQAKGIKYYPGITSHHNAPDPKQSQNMSTAVSELQKLLFRSYVLDKALLFAKNADIRNKAAVGKSYTLKRIATLLSKQGQHTQAFHYATQAIAGGMNIKWLAYSFYLGLRKIFQLSKS